jgi:DNA-binding CsgD family transcriptional regulator
MERLSQSDLDRIQVFLQQTSVPCDLASFPSLILPAVHDLVPGDIVCLSESDEASQKSVTFEVYPEGAHMDTDLFDLFMFDHPVFQYWAEVAGSPTACTSQVTSMRQWHRTDLYQTVYRPLGLEDSLGMALPARPGLVACICIERSHRFSDRDRIVVEMVRPYITQLYRNAEMVSLLGQSAGRDDVKAIVMDAGGRPLRADQGARALLETYVGSQIDPTSGLPLPVSHWLHGQLTQSAEPDIGAAPSPMVIRGEDGGSLTLRLIPGVRTAEQALLVLQEQRPRVSEISPQFGLSDRERDVLTLARRGLRSADIADELRISRRTVEKHFENVYCKLGVETRAAAVATAFLPPD